MSQAASWVALRAGEWCASYASGAADLLSGAWTCVALWARQALVLGPYAASDAARAAAVPGQIRREDQTQAVGRRTLEGLAVRHPPQNWSRTGLPRPSVRLLTVSVLRAGDVAPIRP
jgi:hypothetical protein